MAEQTVFLPNGDMLTKTEEGLYFVATLLGTGVPLFSPSSLRYGVPLLISEEEGDYFWNNTQQQLEGLKKLIGKVDWLPGDKEDYL